MGHRVLVDRWAGSDLEQLQVAFPGVRRDDFGKGQTVRDAQEIFGPSGARLPAAAHRKFPSKYSQSRQLDSRPLDAAQAALRVWELPLPGSLPVLLPWDVRSDAQLTKALPVEQKPDGLVRHWELSLPALLLFPPGVAREQPGLQELCAKSPVPGRRASARQPQEPVPEPMSQPGGQSLLSRLRFSQLPPRPLPPPGPGNVSVRAPRVRYRSSLSVSSFP